MGHAVAVTSRIPPGVVVGAKAVLKAAAARPVRRVVVAADAPAAVTDPARRLATERAVPLIEVPTSEELGRYCGIDRPVAVAAEVGT